MGSALPYNDRVTEDKPHPHQIVNTALQEYELSTSL
jgi:hypothetical protein